MAGTGIESGQFTLRVKVPDMNLILFRDGSGRLTVRIA